MTRALLEVNVPIALIESDRSLQRGSMAPVRSRTCIWLPLQRTVAGATLDGGVSTAAVPLAQWTHLLKL